ncbi:MAG: carboxypeptidase regulatory-like domain-containing protein [Acidobacteria bacterium]|nr:carboxypeptidase regulatory-like domain-containing protein [Acidobacteriota bacterium]
MSIRTLALALALVVFLPLGVSAQEASIVGAVVDETKAVLPGATVTATALDTGRQFVDVTNERGEFRLVGMQPGTYKVQAELPGFTSVLFPQVELLVGQNRTVPFTLQVATVNETLTVTGEAPLVDTRSSQVSGNIDRRQMEELPLQGRNWMELAMIVKGITANAVDNQPGVRDRQFQLNLDGQEITQQVAGSGFGQPRFSREAIAEFQVITNLFDITQGRSLGIQVQAISRSGTNNINGSFYGFFRDARFNEKDFVANRVLPYSNQQVGGTIGGPLVRDKLHYFLSYEYEREPNTIFTRPPLLAGQSFSFDTKLTQTSFLGRVDHQWSARDHLTGRASYWDWQNPFTQVSGTEHPSQAANRTRKAVNIVGTWARVLGDSMLQELKIGFTHFDWKNLLAVEALANSPNYAIPGMPIGGRRNYPQEFFQNTYSARYDLNWHRSAHDFKLGGEFLRWHDTGQWQLLSRGEFVFNVIPTDLARRFPADAWNDPSRWDVSGLDAFVQRYDQNFGDWTIDIPRPTWAIWFGDTWALGSRFTVNYGVRWDDDYGATAPPHVTTTVPWEPRGGNQMLDVALTVGQPLYRSDIRDHNNVAPRGGFTWNVTGNNDFVIRGGSGLYYSIPDSNTTFSQQSFNGQRILVNSFPNDRQPGFVGNPTRGLTAQDFISGRAPLPAQSPRVIAHDYQMPHTWQSILGFQKQIGQVMSVEADLTHWKGYNFARQRDPNLFLNPANGYNLNPSAAGRPDPKFTLIQWLESRGRADYAAISSALTRRYRNNFQASAAYTLMLFMHDNTTGFQSQGNNTFDPEAEWARSTEFQRHTLRLTGIYQLPWGFSASGAYFYGSGNYFTTTISGNPFGAGGTNRLHTGAPVTIAESVRARFDGPDVIERNSVVPRNALQGLPLHKVDIRIAKDFKIARDVKITGIAEVFNLFNHANYGAYNGVVNTVTFGNPAQSLLNAYLPRVLQLAFRVGF